MGIRGLTSTVTKLTKIGVALASVNLLVSCTPRILEPELPPDFNASSAFLQLISITPGTHGSNLTPTVRGASSLPIATSVQLFSNSTCTTPLASGSYGNFVNPGFSIPAAANASVSIYGIAYINSGSVQITPCTFLSTYTHDNINPVVTLTSPVNGSTLNSSQVSSVTFSGACSENGRPVQITGSTVATFTCAGGSFSGNIDLSSLADGALNFTATQTDLAGNSGSSATVSVTKDATVPTVAWSAPAAGSFINLANVSSFAVSGTCSENGRNVVISGAASASIACAAGAWSTTLDLSAAPQGSVTLTLNHSDAIGNAATPASRAFMKDTLAPTVAISSPAAGSNITGANVSSFAVSGTCSENTVNVIITGDASATVACSSGTWTANLNFSAAADGTVSINVNHSDLAGNAATTASRSFNKDTSIPSVAFTSPPAGSYANISNAASFAVSGTCSENGRNVVISGAASATVACAAGAWSTTLNLSAVAQGGFTLLADHSDAGGNNAPQASLALNKDTVAPTLAFSSPAAGSNITSANQASFTVVGTCSENGRNVVISGDASATPVCLAGGWTVNLNLSALADGPVSILIDHSDAAGNPAAQQTRSFNKDASVPLVAISLPAAGAYANISNQSSFALSGTCSENGRTVSISGSVTSSATCSAGAWSVNLDVSGLADGAWSINVDHSDAVGNSAVTATRAFNKDTAAPTLAITAPAAGSFVTPANAAAFAVSGTCSENGQTVSISGSATSSATCTAGAWSVNLDFSALADGPVSVLADMSDVAGNPATQASRSFTKNSAVPTVTFTTPAANSYVNSANQAAFSVSGSCSENGQNVVLSGAASGTVACAANVWTLVLDLSALGQGAFTLYADHSNAASTPATQASRSFIKDSVAPTVLVTSPAANSFINAANQGSYSVLGTCSENGRNVVISGDASATVSCLAGAWTANLDFTAAANGNVTINVNHSDAAGNTATQDSRTFIKDAVVPTVAITSPAANSYVTPANMAAFAISGSCSENGRNVVISGGGSATVACSGGSWSTSVNLSAASEGFVTLYVDHTDAAGNSATQDARSFIKDTAIPTVSFNSPAAGSYINSANMNSFAVNGFCSESGRNVVISGAASATVTCSGGTWSANLNVSAAADGSVTLYADHSDDGGNNATQASRTFNKVSDPGGANSILIAGGASHTSSSTVSLTLHSDNYTSQMYITNTAGCASGGSWEPYNTAKAGWVLGQTNGTATVYVRYIDIAGNISSCVSDTIIHDDVVPTVAFTTPAANSYVNSASVAAFTVNGSCSENGRNVVISGAASATVACTAGAWTANVDLTAAAQGNLTLYADHSDVASNNATQASRVFVKDTVAPTLAITAYDPTVNASNVTAWNVSGTCSENGQSVSLRDTGGSLGSTTCSGGTWSIAANLSAKSDGTLTLFARTSDAAGNTTDTSDINVPKDVGIPLVAITSPAAGSNITALNQASFTVSGTCSENTRNVTLSGAASGTTVCTAGSWSINLDFTGAADGSVTVYADHTDSAGNSATQASRSFNKDASPPTLAITSPAAGSNINSSNVASFAVSGTCSENGRNVVITGSASGTVSCSAGTWTANLDFSGASEGTVTIFADHSDAGGNSAPQASRSFNKDVGVPLVAITSPAANSYANASNYTAWTVSGTCSENGRTVSISAGGGAVTASPSCSAGTWTTNLNLTAISDGAFTVLADHSDAAGNNATQASRSFNKDIVAPSSHSISIAAGAATTNANPVALTLAASGATEMYITNTAGCASDGAWEAYSTSKASWTLGQTNATATVYVKFRDVALNESSCVNDTIVHDTIVPTVAITSPAANSYANASNYTAWTVSGTCSENGRTVSVSAGGGTVTASPSCSAGTWTTNLNLTAISDGAFTVLADHSDAAGNNATQDSRSFNKDIVAPSSHSISIAGGAATTNANPVALTLAATGATEMYITNTAGCGSGGAWEAYSTSKASWTLGQTNATATVYVKFRDVALNESSCVNDTIVHDTIVPTVAITSPAANSYANASNYTAWTVSGTCSENGRTVSVSAGGGTVTASPSCSAGTWTTNLNLTAISDGAFTVLADHSDAAGNNATQDSRSFNKDIGVPTTTIASPANGAFITLANQASFSVSGSCSENGRAVGVFFGDGTNFQSSSPTCTAGSYSTTLNLTSLNSGSIQLNLNHSDVAGNAATEIIYTFTKDVTVPTVAITSPAANSYANASNYTAWTVSGTCSENGRTVSISAGGGAVTASPVCSAGAWTTNLNLTAISDGAFTVLADHSDAAGNNATQASRSFNKDIVGITLTTNSTTGTVNSGTISRTIYTTGASSVSLSAASTTWTFTGTATCTTETIVTVVANSEYRSDLTGCSGDGTAYLSAIAAGVATDAAGNTSAAWNSGGATNVWTVDNTAPTVSISTPVANTWCHDNPNNTATLRCSTFRVTGACSENGRAVSVSAGGGTATGSATCSSSSWTIDLNVNAISDGSYSFTANHSDLAGNTASQASRTFRKDTVPPVFTVTSPNGGETVLNGSASNFTYTRSDTLSGFDGTTTVRVDITYNNGTSYTVLTFGDPDTGTYSYTPTTNSTQVKMLGMIRDVAGNQAFDESNAVFTVSSGTVPTAPTNLVATNLPVAVSLTWTASTGLPAPKYEVLRGTTSGSYSVVASNLSTTYWDDANCARNTTYYYVVRATNVNGTSANSNEATVYAELTPTLALNLTRNTITPQVGDQTFVFNRTDTGYTATHYGADGLLRFAPHNFLLQSNTFNTSWTLGAATISANVDVSPSGATDADRLTENTTNTYHQVSQAISKGSASVPFTASVYAKMASRRYMAVTVSGANIANYAQARYDLQSGTVVTSLTGGTGFAVTSATVQAVGNGWYRLILSGTTDASNSATTWIAMMSNSTTLSYAGTNGNYISIWGAQLEQNRSASPLLATTTAARYDGPRYDYDPVTRAPRGLLVEQNATNLSLYSDQFNHTTWQKLNITVATDTTETIDPMGGNAAEKVTENSSSGYHRILQNMTKSNQSRAVAFSAYIKKGTREQVGLQLNSGGGGAIGTFNLTNLVKTNATWNTWSNSGSKLEDVGNGWYRATVWATSDTDTSFECQLLLYNESSASNYLGNGTGSFYYYGAQVEEIAMQHSSVSGTSYIPTTASTVSRNGEYLQTSGALGSWHSTTGTWYVDFRMDRNNKNGAAGGNVIRAHTGTSFGNNDYSAGVGYGLSVSFGSFSGGFRTLSSWEQWEEGGITNTDDFKLAFNISNNVTLARLNGNAANSPTTNASMSIVPTVITFGAAASDFTQPFNGWIRELRFYNFNLSATELATLTSQTPVGFSDDFENSNMLSRWSTMYSSGLVDWSNAGGTHTFTINENSGQLRVAQTWSHNYDGYVTNGNTYNLNNKFVSIELIQAGRNIQSDNNNGGCGNETSIGILDPTNLTTVQYGPKQYLMDGQYLNLYGQLESPNNSWTEYNSSSSTAYSDNPSNHRFFRVRHDSSNDRIYLDHSADGWNWSNHANFARPAQVNVNAVRLFISSGAYCFDADFNGYSPAIFDNFSTNAPQN